MRYRGRYSGSGIPGAPLTYGTYVRRVLQTLTDKTTFTGTTAEQWGTEEATHAAALLPKLTDVTVYAEVKGRISDFTTAAAALGIVVEISLDGGTTWSTGRTIHQRSAGTTTTEMDHYTNDHQVTGTVTGDIQARAMTVSAVGAADSRNYVDCAINMEVLVHP